MASNGFERSDDAAARALRRDAPASAAVMGYETRSGAPRAMRGDDDFAYLKDPPDISEGGELANADNPLPLVVAAADYAISPEVDVNGWRQLVLFLNYHMGVDGQFNSAGVLSMYLQGIQDEVSPIWTVAGVVDSTLGGVGVITGATRRYLYGSELCINPTRDPGSAIPVAAPAAPAEINLEVSFDVAVHVKVRLLMGDLVATNASLGARYLLLR